MRLSVADSQFLTSPFRERLEPDHMFAGIFMQPTV
jgi:hypothetical protein